MSNSAVLTLTVTGNTLTGIGGYGIYTGAHTGASLSGTVASNQLQTVGSYGIYGYAQDAGSTLDVAVTGNGIDGTGNDGIYLYSNTWQTSFPVVVDGNTVSNAAGGSSDGIYVANSDAVAVTNNTVTTVGGYGVYVDPGMTAAARVR